MLVAIPLGLAIGIALGMLGGGGSILVLPVLTYGLGQSAQEAATASLVIVTVAALAGGAGQARADNVCWRHALLFTAAALPLIVAGTAVGDAVSGRALLIAFGVVMLIAAAAMVRNQALRSGPSSARVGCPALDARWDVGSGAGVGFLTGFLGVGGGFLVVPVLALALGFSIRAAIGTSLVVITATGIVGAAIHLAAGRPLDLAVVAALSAAMVVGALVGARAGRLLPERVLARSFAALAVAVGTFVIASSALFGGPPGA